MQNRIWNRFPGAFFRNRIGIRALDRKSTHRHISGRQTSRRRIFLPSKKTDRRITDRMPTPTVVAACGRMRN